MERSYTESEIRAAFDEAWQHSKIPSEVFDEVARRLFGPRLKPDCPVLIDGPDAKDLLGRAREVYPSQTNVRPLVRADRVMEWAQAYRDYHATSATCGSFFAERIREETEES